MNQSEIYFIINMRDFQTHRKVNKFIHQLYNYNLSYEINFPGASI